MQIENTRWYTAKMTKMRPIPDSERVTIEHINGYVMRMGGWSDAEIKEHVDSLAAAGIVGKVDVLGHDLDDIPAGEKYLRISKKESIKNLEKLFKEQGLVYSHEVVSPRMFSHKRDGR